MGFWRKKAEDVAKDLERDLREQGTEVVSMLKLDYKREGGDMVYFMHLNEDAQKTLNKGPIMEIGRVNAELFVGDNDPNIAGVGMVLKSGLNAWLERMYPDCPVHEVDYNKS